MINGGCRTNLDDYNFEEWPEEFVAVPQKGDRVRSKSGKILWVVGITHMMVDDINDPNYGRGFSPPQIPHIQIELIEALLPINWRRFFFQ